MALTLAQEFPRRETADICAEFYGQRPYPRELRDAELALQWLYMEEDGKIQYCPPREGVDIRRDIRKQRTRLGWLRRLART